MAPLPDLSQPSWFLAVLLAIFVVIVERYFLIAGLFCLFFYRHSPEKWQQRKINHRKYSAQQFRREVGWSTVTAFIFFSCRCAVYHTVAEGIVESLYRPK
jgi:hypothetical protein